MKYFFTIVIGLLSFIGVQAQSPVPEWFFEQGDGVYCGCAPALSDMPKVRHEMAIASALIAYSIDNKVYNTKLAYKVEDSYVNGIGEEFVRLTVVPDGNTHLNVQHFVNRGEDGSIRCLLEMFYDRTYFKVSGVKQSASSEKYSVELSSEAKGGDVLYFKDIFQCMSEDTVLKTLRYPDSGSSEGSRHGYDCSASLFVAYCKVLILDTKLPVGINDNKLCY